MARVVRAHCAWVSESRPQPPLIMIKVCPEDTRRIPGYARRQNPSSYCNSIVQYVVVVCSGYNIILARHHERRGHNRLPEGRGANQRQAAPFLAGESVLGPGFGLRRLIECPSTASNTA